MSSRAGKEPRRAGGHAEAGRGTGSGVFDDLRVGLTRGPFAAVPTSLGRCWPERAIIGVGIAQEDIRHGPTNEFFRVRELFWMDQAIDPFHGTAAKFWKRAYPAAALDPPRASHL
jgi:hypothetical protein